MNNPMRTVIAALAFVAAGYAGSVAAQEPVSQVATYINEHGDGINCRSVEGQVESCGEAYRTPVTREERGNRCVSTGEGRTYCGRVSVAYVAETDNPICVEGSTWGIDSDGRLWVSGHCSAYF